MMKPVNHVTGFLLQLCMGTCLCLAGSGSASAKAYSLDELLALAKRGNPGLIAGAEATAGVEARLLEAHRYYWPTGDAITTFAPVPRIECFGPTTKNADGTTNPPVRNEQECVSTNLKFTTSNALAAITDLRGVFWRSQINLVQPVYTFGKLSAGVAAAELGVEASRNREASIWADLELNVRKAYWGAKLAREILDTLKEGTEYLNEADQKIEKELADGTGNATVADRLRLRTVRSELESRMLEADRGSGLAVAGLRALLGGTAPADLDVDNTPLEMQGTVTRTLADCQDQAQTSRPEILALNHLVAAKRALADLEWRRQYPDVILLGSATFAYTNSVDNPQNAYLNDPFHTTAVGLAAGIRLPLDLGIRNANAHRLRAEAAETQAKRSEAVYGINFEIQKAFLEMQEASKRVKILQRGEKAARQWIASVMQNLALGLAESRDFSDALLAFFQSRLRYLQGIYDYQVAVAALSRATGTDVATQ